MREIKNYKAEPFDQMQYFYQSVHEPFIHCVIHFENQIDEQRLKRAVVLSYKEIPLIGCLFQIEKKRPRWIEGKFHIEDIVKIVSVDNEMAGHKMIENNQQESIYNTSFDHNIDDSKEGLKQILIDKYLSTTWDISLEPQLKIFIIRDDKQDILLFIMNHMVCDGAGFKEYLYILSNFYSNIDNMKEEKLTFTLNQRSNQQIYKGFRLFERIKIGLLKYDSSIQKQQAGISLNGDKNNPFFITHKIEKDKFDAIKIRAKCLGVSVNDMILAAYARRLKVHTKNRRIIIPCPVDLRKYCCEKDVHRICNLTTNYICDVTLDDKESFETTVNKISKIMLKQKNSDNSLKSVIMLNIAFRLIPFPIMTKVFSKLFSIPIISYTNLGIIEKENIRYKNSDISQVYMTGAVKYVPYFQIAVSTYDDVLTLSCNLYGTKDDQKWIKDFLCEIESELLS